jgi:outer membrane protein assembly factor BamB
MPHVSALGSRGRVHFAAAKDISRVQDFTGSRRSADMMWRGISAAGSIMLTFAAIAASLAAWAQPRQDAAQDHAAQGNSVQDNSVQDNVLTYHGSADRSGAFVVPGLTWQRAKSLHVDEKFRARVAGNVYAQPLYWRAPGSNRGLLLVATEENTVQALDAATGDEIWKRPLGKPVTRAALRCGNIDPLGITGTPVIDEATGSLYLDANVADSSGPRHRLFALSLKDGSVMPGWPIDVTDGLRAVKQSFNSRDQNQRGALTILEGMLYVPFGGHFGDCGDYHGWVVGVLLQDPRKVTSWSTRARGGGIWAPGGISVVGRSLFVATGNTFGASTWSDGEAVFRLAPDLHRSGDRSDFFAPANWLALDQRDADLGGTHPIPLTAGVANRRQALVLALGKDGRGYLLDQNSLGGIGGGLAAETVSPRPIRTAPAVYSVDGNAYVALQGAGAHCPSPARDGQLTVLKIGPGERPNLSTAWCGTFSGAGSPIVTTSDGQADPIVWVVGAEGDNRLHGFRGDNGEPLFSGGSGPVMTGLHHFQTLIATRDHLYVGADGRVYAFAF